MLVTSNPSEFSPEPARGVAFRAFFRCFQSSLCSLFFLYL
ncbi:hypothetical protein CTO_0961 [Chlamydia trachomatis A2497]|uniref:Uncharacterized protein n=1 Tax=Chlamydia trachomatis serovar A (strain A2497) TaxID=580047 RepID=G4NP62_CHLT4|nr:hypothetical protein CTO_0961 [Chlamydia trachomatis A2497]